MEERTDPRDLKVPGGPVIPGRELRWRATGAGGPGGQHANTSNTRVEVVFDVAGSSVLSDDEKQRVIEKLGRLVRVVVSDERSQYRNRALAAERLSDRLADALEVPAERRATRPSRREQARRRSERERQQQRKQKRRWVYRPDE